MSIAACNNPGLSLKTIKFALSESLGTKNIGVMPMQWKVQSIEVIYLFIFLPSYTLDAMVTPQVLSACGVWGVKTGVQISRREFHTHKF